MNDKFPAGQELLHTTPHEAAGLAQREEPAQRGQWDPRSAAGSPRPAFAGNGRAPEAPFDAWPLVELLLHRWRRLAFCGSVLAAFGLLAGVLAWHKQSTAAAQLVRYESPNTVEVFGFRQISPQTFASMFRSPELLQRVSAKARPSISVDALATGLRVVPERNSEVVAVAVSAISPDAAVDLANLYAREAVRYTQEVQARSAAEVSQYLSQQVAQMDEDINALNRRWWALPRPSLHSSSSSNRVTALPVSPRATQLTGRVDAARDDLLVLLERFTDAHPLVQAQRAKIAALEQQLAASSQASSTPAAASAGVPNNSALTSKPSPTKSVVVSQADTDPEIIRSKLAALETGRMTLAGRLRAARLFEESPPGYFRVLALAMPKDVVTHGRTLKVVFLAVFFGLAGTLGAAALVLFSEVIDDRLKTAADVKRVTRLPVLASIKDLQGMSTGAQHNWAFRTWTMLQRHMSLSPNHGLVCGVTSSSEGEGRSTWVSALAQAASQRGFRVLTIATQPTSEATHATEAKQHSPPAPPQNGAPPVSPDAEALSRMANVLATPAEVTQKLVGPDSQPLVHIPLPGWVWNLERRKQWQAALNHWRQIDNIVILVELPPASQPEAVLLAENLPNLIWLAESGKARAAETREQLETLRNARCNLVGAVLNREVGRSLKALFPRWVDCTL